ncbi:MAG: hypothetical protein ACK56W_15515 [Pirellula sp.]|jgi:hypothetical protein
MAIKGVSPSTAFFCFFAFIFSMAGGPLSAQTIHAIVLGDLSPAAGWGKLAPNIVLDTLTIGGMLESNMPERQLNLLNMQLTEDDQSDPTRVLKLIYELNPRPVDTVVFYYSGHGASDDQGHYLAMANGKLHRKKVLDAMLRKGPRLAVLITDCCNLRSDGQMFFAPFFQVDRPSSPTPLFRSLFLEPKGIVDVNSSAPGEGAFFAPSGDDIGSKRGSIFTIGLTAWVEKNQSQRRIWDELVRGVSLHVHASFHDYYPKGIQASKGDQVQTQQNVFPIQYPGMPENKGPRTGFLIRDFPGKGAVITKVEANSPASQVFLVDKEVFASLSPQQVIISINGKPVETTEQVVKAIAQSPQIARLRIREAIKGEFDVLIRMRY